MAQSDAQADDTDEEIEDADDVEMDAETDPAPEPDAGEEAPETDEQEADGDTDDDVFDAEGDPFDDMDFDDGETAEMAPPAGEGVGPGGETGDVDMAPGGTPAGDGSADPDFVCETAFNAAIESAIDRCAGADSVAGQTVGFAGLEEDADLAPTEVLSEGVTEDVLSDPRKMREWVHARVHHAPPDGGQPLLSKHNGDIRAAFREAWGMVDDAK